MTWSSTRCAAIPAFRRSTTRTIGRCSRLRAAETRQVEFAIGGRGRTHAVDENRDALSAGKLHDTGLTVAFGQIRADLRVGAFELRRVLAVRENDRHSLLL